MKFSKIYREALRFWPSEIIISDGELHEGDGGYFPTLSKIWSLAEDHSDLWNEMHKTMVWAIFCGLHKKAVLSLACGGISVSKYSIDKDYVEYKFSESLLGGGRWFKQARKSYVNDLHNSIRN